MEKKLCICGEYEAMEYEKNGNKYAVVLHPLCSGRLWKNDKLIREHSEKIDTSNTPEEHIKAIADFNRAFMR